LVGDPNRYDCAEERHASDEIDATVDEASGQRRLEVRDAIACVVDDLSAIQEPVHEARTCAESHAVTDERVAEDPRAAGDQRRKVVEYRALGGEVSGEAMKDASERDRIERWAFDSVQRPEHVPLVAPRLKSSESPEGVVQAVWLKIDQRQSGTIETAAALVQAVARPDTDVGMVCRQVRAIVLDEALGWAAPYALSEHSHYQRVV
jgi:hypothetical protein